MNKKKCTDEFLKVKKLEEGEKNVEICETCKHKVKENQYGVICDGCEKWFHGACQNVSTEEYKYLTLVDVIMWFCSGCKNKYKEMKEENKTLKEENKNLKHENEVLKKRLTKLEAKVENIERESVDGMKRLWDEVEGRVKHFMTKLHEELREDKQQIISEVREQVMQEVVEREEHQRRQKNLVIYGVCESVEDTGRQRENEDIEFCKRLFDEELNIKYVQIEGIVRLGKKNPGEDNQRSKPRPMLVKLNGTREKFDILKRGSQLKQSRNTQVQRIVIAPDLTRLERERDKKLREELKEKQQKGERGWFIKKGRLQRNFQQ